MVRGGFSCWRRWREEAFIVDDDGLDYGDDDDGLSYGDDDDDFPLSSGEFEGRLLVGRTEGDVDKGSPKQQHYLRLLLVPRRQRQESSRHPKRRWRGSRHCPWLWNWKAEEEEQNGSEGRGECGIRFVVGRLTMVVRSGFWEKEEEIWAVKWKKKGIFIFGSLVMKYFRR